MAVHAHPDDESSKGAATMARYAREGADVLVCTLTGGERGDILNKAMERPDVRANLPEVRRSEMARAREILGVQQQFLGFIDSGLPEGDPLPPLPEGCFALEPIHVAVRPLVKAVREFRPQVILTYDERGGYPHPDHVKTHEVSVAAFEAAADPAKPSVSAIVRLTWGPKSSVTGLSSTPGSRNDVFHIRLMPRGQFNAVVTSAGRCPCATAVAEYRMNQANRSTSSGSPTWARDAGSTHNRQVSATAPSR